jgi:hypothetical protein
VAAVLTTLSRLLSRLRLSALLLLARLLAAAALLLARTRVVLLLLAGVLARIVGVRHSFLLDGYATLAPRGSTPTREQSCAAKL